MAARLCSLGNPKASRGAAETERSSRKATTHRGAVDPRGGLSAGGSGSVRGRGGPGRGGPGRGGPGRGGPGRGGPGRLLPTKPKVKPRVKTRALHWERILLGSEESKNARLAKLEEEARNVSTFEFKSGNSSNVEPSIWLETVEPSLDLDLVDAVLDLSKLKINRKCQKKYLAMAALASKRKVIQKKNPRLKNCVLLILPCTTVAIMLSKPPRHRSSRFYFLVG